MIYCDYKFTSPTSSLAESANIKGCVYLIVSSGVVRYVGSTTRLYKRICEHKCKKFKSVYFEYCFIETDDYINIEQDIINRLKPPENIMLSNSHEAKAKSQSYLDIAKKILKK